MYDSFYDVVLPQPEIWKPVKGYEGLYEVSNYGVVRSLPRKRSWWREDIQSYTTRVFKGKIMTAKLKSTGYKDVHLRDESRHNYWTLHKIVSEAFHEDLHLPVIDHKDDNKGHNFLWNLQRCTVQYNTEKAFKNGQLISGNSGYRSKLPDQVKDVVRNLLQQGLSMRRIEREVGVSQRSIARIRDGEI